MTPYLQELCQLLDAGQTNLAYYKRIKMHYVMSVPSGHQLDYSYWHRQAQTDFRKAHQILAFWESYPAVPVLLTC